MEKAVSLLEHSLRAFKPYDPDKDYSPEELEYYDSLSFRFEKAVEITLSFFKTLEIYLFGEQSDTLRSRLLRLQKAGYIENPEFWLEARILRNKIAHAYLPEELKEIYEGIFNFSKEILRQAQYLKEKLKSEGVTDE